jgi:predicted secreted Zn-dependent protease
MNENDMKASSNLLFVALALCAVSVCAEPAARVGASYYYIEGTSALVLTAQMNNKGPAGPDGRNHPSLTKWDVQWRFRHNMLGGVCQMEVDRNEAFHKEQALDAGRKIEAALENLVPATDCEALTIAANEAAIAILEKHKAASRDHNERTDYGRKNGVSLI